MIYYLIFDFHRFKIIIYDLRYNFITHGIISIDKKCFFKTSTFIKKFTFQNTWSCANKFLFIYLFFFVQQFREKVRQLI